jgi:5'-nucleotidase
MAVSMNSYVPEHYDSGAKAVMQLLAELDKTSFASNTILNINVPDVAWSEIKGFKATRLGNRHKSEGVIIQDDPRGEPMYWVGPPGAAQDAGEGTDFHAVSNNYISVTPLQIDLTRYDSLADLESWLSPKGGK